MEIIDLIRYILNLDVYSCFVREMLLRWLSEREWEYAYEASVVLYLAQGSYNTGALGLACLHYIVTTHATSLFRQKDGF